MQLGYRGVTIVIFVRIDSESVVPRLQVTCKSKVLEFLGLALCLMHRYLVTVKLYDDNHP